MAEPKSKRMANNPKPNGGDPEELGPVGFESSIQRLGEIVETLEQGELPLEESLRLFEEGIKLARSSQRVLDRAEARVEELLAVDDEGNATVRVLDQDSD